MRKLVLALAILLLSLPMAALTSNGCDGAYNCYVRAGASGTGTGASWTNAYTGFGTGAGQMNPSSMTAGVTYWMAAGTYTAPTWTASGAPGNPIVVEAATASVHGAAGDWSSGYAGQAVFSGVTTLTGSYWTINGQSTGATYPTNTAQNIKFWNASNGSQWAFGNSTTGTFTNWTLEYVEILGTNTAGSAYSDEGFQCGSGTTATCSNINLLYDWIHAAGTDLISSNSWSGNVGTGWVIDHSWLDHNCADQYCSPSQTHAQGAQITVSNLTVSNSVWQDMMSSGFITDANGDTGSGPVKSGWYIYNNIFFWDAAFAANSYVQSVGIGDGILGDFNTAPSGSAFYGNTIYGIISTGSGACSSSVWYAQPSDAKTENNLWEQTTGCNPVDSSGASGFGYNTYGKNSSNSSDTSSTKQTASTEFLTSPTSSTVAGFALASDTTAGVTLASPYNVDLLGTTRAANGTWDRGALQITGSITNYTLTTSVTGTGAGQITGSNCTTGSYASGTVATCTATATAGSFISWSGTGSAASCAANPCTFSITSNSTLQATINTPVVYALTFQSSGTGACTSSGLTGSYAAGAAYSGTITASSGSLTSASGCGGSLSGGTYSGIMPGSACAVTAVCTASGSGTAIGPPATQISKFGSIQALGSVTAGTMNPVTIGGATGSCTGKVAMADGTGCVANGSGSVTGGSCSANQYATSVGSNGAPTCAQVAYGQVSGTPAIPAAQVAANLASSGSTGVTGTLPASQVGSGYPYSSLVSPPTIPTLSSLGLTNAVTGPLSAASGNFPVLDSTGKVLSDSGKSASSFDPAGAASTVNTALTAEATARAAADTTNSTAITTEASTARSAEATNATAISAEATRATTAEGLKAPIASPAFTGNGSITGSFAAGTTVSAGPNSWGHSVENISAAPVSALASLTTTNASILGVGSTVWVYDGVSCGDVSMGGGSIWERLYCNTLTSGACSQWLTMACSVGSSGTALATPIFAPDAGTYSNNQSVAMSAATGATICYTTNGTTPAATTGGTCSTGSTYSSAVSVSATATQLQAIATEAGFTNSGVKNSTYTLTAAQPVDSPGTGTYSSSQSVTLTSATTGAAIYYTTDGSTPTTSSTLYSGAITVGATETIKALAANASYNNSGVLSSPYTINLTQVATPTFSAGTGTYNNNQSITVSDGTAGATICYRTDGTNPSTSSPGTCGAGSTTYSTAVSISATATQLKALATKSGLTDSSVASATYALTAATPVDSPGTGTYTGTQSVTLSSATTGSAIVYCTDTNNTCTPSTSYSGAISVSSTSYVRAQSTLSGYNSSTVMSSLYTINTPQVVSCNNMVSASNTSVACSMSGVTAGSVIVVWAFPTTAWTVSSVTDSAGATSNVLNACTAGTGGGQKECIYYFKNVAAGSHTITMNTSGSTTYDFMIATAMSGVSTTSPTDTFSMVSGTGGPTVTTSITPSATGEYVVGAYWDNANAQTVTSFGSGFNVTTGYLNGTSTADGSRGAFWASSTSASPLTITSTLANGSGTNWNLSAVTVH